ncbi:MULTISPECIES: porin [unclassified Lentilitoribacter]|uniref:porin n=1 Tax=unclassified Lentilitoribacter TaxID=2647570 RepID=UPI0013A696FA|nr:porin [Lentilitoribacter sp. Alg239-R112]
MTIKSLLIGSAAAVVAASSAQAADAVVAADPEPVEYVQVCQDFGTGYFYIPGTETCLKIGGYVRALATYTDVSGGSAADTTTFDHDVRLTLDANSSTELGTLAAHVRLDETGTTTAARRLNVDRAHISIGDGNVFNIGLNGSIYDSSIVGEQFFNPEGSTGNQVQYTVALDSATFYVQAVAGTTTGTGVPQTIAGDIAARVDFAAGDLGVKLFYGYDGDNTSTAGGRSGAKIELSYMGFGAYYAWSEKGNGNFAGLAGTTGTSFGSGAKNVFGVGYGFDATDKLNIAFAADFADGIQNVGARDAYGISAIASYTIVEGLVADARVKYWDFNNAATTGNAALTDRTEVRFRLTRSF